MSFKIGFVLPNLAGGGAEKAILKIGAGLAARGHAVHVVLLENVIAHPSPPGIELHTLGARIARGAIGKWRSARRLGALVERIEASGAFDLIVSSLPFADEVAVRAHLPRLWCRIANMLSAARG